MGFDVLVSCEFFSEGLIGEDVFENINVFVENDLMTKSKSFIYFTGQYNLTINNLTSYGQFDSSSYLLYIDQSTSCVPFDNKTQVISISNLTLSSKNNRNSIHLGSSEYYF